MTTPSRCCLSGLVITIGKRWSWTEVSQTLLCYSSPHGHDSKINPPLDLKISLMGGKLLRTGFFSALSMQYVQTSQTEKTFCHKSTGPELYISVSILFCLVAIYKVVSNVPVQFFLIFHGHQYVFSTNWIENHVKRMALIACQKVRYANNRNAPLQSCGFWAGGLSDEKIRFSFVRYAHSAAFAQVSKISWAPQRRVSGSLTSVLASFKSNSWEEELETHFGVSLWLLRVWIDIRESNGHFWNHNIY